MKIILAGVALAALLSSATARAEANFASVPAKGEPVCAIDTIGGLGGCASSTQLTKFTITGCSIVTSTGGEAAGTYTVPAAGACSAVITFASAAPLGWAVAANDLTAGNTVRQTATTATTATLSVTTSGTNEVVVFSARRY